MRKIFSILVFSLVALSTLWAYQPKHSVAGMFPLEESGRDVYNFNLGWHYYRGDVPAAQTKDFDDTSWEVVSVPHTVQLIPAEGSGSRNYQGKAWYRKHFVVDPALQGKRVQIYFEAVMGKATLYLNGDSILQHFGGYLPFAICLNDYGVKAGDTCVIALCADNSNDKTYPPGKPQYTLDFTYHGGIYRDVWMIAKGEQYITDAVVERHEVAGGGVFLHYDNISSDKAIIYVDTEIANKASKQASLTLETTLCDKEGKVIKTLRSPLKVSAGAYQRVSQSFQVKNPHLWSPDDPYLYQVKMVLKQGKKALDGGMLRAGIRKVEFKGKDGFYLNGKPYKQLIGVNRHQDFAYVGNALPNSQHWRDAKILREGGCTIVRSAHYPQDPAWMDACDELGIFMIVPTPGWQYWNKAPQFKDYVLDDVTQMIRRDRNHTSVLLWEPILNETRFPEDFSLQALQITKDEFPYPGAPLAVADMHSAGVSEHYGVVYGWPTDTGKVEQCIFTREFGEMVDDWYAQNNNNRVSRSWGEGPMRVQAMSLANSYGEMFYGQKQFIGGAQWHAFDHQRGYHPDPYWGGQCDAFRQQKYVYQMFKSQVSADATHPMVETGPMVFIAHEVMPYFGNDIMVFSNCDSVRLILRGTDTLVQAVKHNDHYLPNEPVIFKDAYDFWKNRQLSYFQKNWQAVTVVAEGIIDGKVVCSETKMPARRSTKLALHIEHADQQLIADGSDFIVVVAEVTDDNGNVRRMAKDNILFEVEGEGVIVGDAAIGANPRAVEFGSAPVLIRSTTTPGKIKVKARVLWEGQMAPSATEIEFESIPASLPACYLHESAQAQSADAQQASQKSADASLDRNRILEEVVQQQADFGEKK
ncbi:MAG: glycoside hydrolase family 2 [Bacteroidales bacterium]|nr:glycoside hydrolase family 2 [Bacteroidales bacterium]